MSAAERYPLMTVQQYLEFERASDQKHEYLGGYVYAMAGAKTQHNRIATNFVSILHAQLRGSPCEPFNSDMKVRTSSSFRTRLYYPDGMVVCDPNHDDADFQDNPVVVAEVLSDSTRRTDESEKRDAYLAIPALSVYLLIEQDSPCVVAYRRDGQDFNREVYEGLEAVVPLDEVTAGLPLAELYERVSFDEN